MALGGVSILVAIASYNHNDPSFNSSGKNTDAISNWLGSMGATLSDLLLQTLGLASIILGLGLAVWGYRIFKRLPITLLWARAACLTIATLFGAATFARIPSGDWLVQAYSGGTAGAGLLNIIARTLNIFGLPFAHTIGAVLAAALTIAALSYALFMGRHIWFAIGLAITKLGYAAIDIAIGFKDWVQHYGDPDFLETKKKARKQERERKAPVIDNPIVTQREEQQAPPTLAAPIKVVAPQSNDAARSSQQRFHFDGSGDWELPSLDLISEGEDQSDKRLDENALRMNAELLQNVLSDFNIKGEIVAIHPGPVVTLYELEPAPGVKSSRIIGLADDIARSMSAVSVRAAVVPGRNVIGIEIPNKSRQFVYLREMLNSREYEKTKAALPLILGKDIGGQPIIADLARMPHLLVAGTTGSGKSVAVNTMILSLLYRLPPEKCRFIMIDPKMLELSVYDDIPHLLSPVVTEPGRAIVALKWVVAEMEERYRSMSKLGVRNIEGYNQRLAEARKKGEIIMRKVQTGFDPETGKPIYEEQPLDLTELPFIVVIVDEFADLMLVAGKEVENAIQRLAQMARAAGIHLIMATQRPSVDVITGVIKANFPTRISFAVTSKIDSRTILGEGGAEQLLGMGDMLYMAAGGQIKRAHGPFSSDDDVENVVNFLKAQGEPAYLDDISDETTFESGGLMGMYGGDDGAEKVDELYDQAVAVVTREGKASTSFIQRHLQIGYNRAARIIEEMERQGVVSPANHAGKRRILVGDHSGE